MITIQHLGYPMEWSDLENALKDPEGPYLEFKESPFLDNSKEIAAQLVSFANRYGGKIFVGVKDDGSIEGATIARDKRSLDVLNVANNNCSPTVDVSFDYANSSSGDVLVISIDRRRGIPHAVIERKTGEIYNRLYYIRSGNGKRLVDDTMLRFLFEHKEDPGFSVTSSLCVWYDRKNLIFSPLESTDYFSDLLPFLQDLNTEDKNHLRSNEFENIQNLILQSFPYAFRQEKNIKVLCSTHRNKK
jgi:hypothetical protein